MFLMAVFLATLFCVVFCVLYVIVFYMYLSTWAAYLGLDTPEKEIVIVFFPG